MGFFAIYVNGTGLNNTKTAVIALIDNVDFVRVFVAEHKEIVID